MKKVLYALAIAAILGIAVLLFVPSYLSTVANPDVVEITVPKGASLSYVSNILFDEGVIKSKIWFRHKAKELQIDHKIKPGTYLIPSNSTFESIFALLEKGVEDEYAVLTVPEGFTLYQTAQKIGKLGLSTKEEFIKATEKYFSNNCDFDTTGLYFKLEGYLYPDTYHFTKNQTVDDIVSQLAQAMDNVFTEKYTEKAKELGLSKHEILTIASLIEREAKHNDERATISGVIYNRLKIDMPLQVDATVIYGEGKGKEHKAVIYQSELNKPGPFNTYTENGLPPGPIASPGKESIKAALYPEKHNYLYYVLSPEEDGHVFNETYDEHLKDRAKYINRDKK
ncbi:MAG TPA: endolytic transglycosylase MltG [Oscillospiraceae bacterium]|nr:endolytic transglycosylase MltG [Oscillospiraceae bacterium]